MLYLQKLPDQYYDDHNCLLIVGPLQRVRPRNGILGLVLVVLVVLPLRSEFIDEL